jgi:hypothetical protein
MSVLRVHGRPSSWLSFTGGLGRWFDRAVGVRVVAVDIGSVKPPSRFAWAAFDTPSQEVVADGSDPDTAVSCLLAGLAEDRQAIWRTPRTWREIRRSAGVGSVSLRESTEGVCPAFGTSLCQPAGIREAPNVLQSPGPR